MYKKDVIDHFGTQRAVAKALGISDAAVSQWKEVIPEKDAYRLEVVTAGALKYQESAYRKAAYSTVELDAILDNLSDEEQIELLELLEEEENYRNTHLLPIPLIASLTGWTRSPISTWTTWLNPCAVLASCGFLWLVKSMAAIRQCASLMRMAAMTWR